MTLILTLHPFNQDQLLKVAAHFADEQGTCLLYSGGQLDSAQHSYLGLFPFETLTIQECQITYLQHGIEKQTIVDNPWDGLNHFFSNRENNLLDYAFGFFGYEMGAFSDLDIRLPYQKATTPDAYWQRCTLVLCVDHAIQTAFVILTEQACQFLSLLHQQWIKELSTQEGWLNLCNQIQSELAPNKPLRAIEQYNRRSHYLSKIERIQEYIRMGDIYQVNLSQQFLFEGYRKPFTIFCQMAHLNPAPFAAYFHVKNFSIVSTSPERFLQKKGTQLETRPIKGTMPRGLTLEEDFHFKEKLLNSMKEKSELLMITDLMRNDLGKISQIGSVNTTDIWRCENYTNVFHLLSIIHAEARTDLTSLDIIRHCFPGGSITGCPKLRAMEVIAELEEKPRGIYTGSIGYLTGQGDFDLNIAIRTLVFKDQSIDLRLGGGIVIDSQPEQEYQETLIKGASLFKILNQET